MRLGQHKAPWTMPILRQAARLRARGLSYPAIAAVLDEYHDFHVSEGAVRHMLRTHGGAIPRPRGGRSGLLNHRAAA